MRIDRFWASQIIIFVALAALLIGSYLFSFGPFAAKISSNPASAATAEHNRGNPQPSRRACTKNGAEASPAAIGESLASNDPAQQKSCLAFLQTESKAGDKGADLWLGRAYHNGWGVEKSLTEAASHYGKAASSDDAAIRDSAKQWQLQLGKEKQKAAPYGCQLTKFSNNFRPSSADFSGCA